MSENFREQLHHLPDYLGHHIELTVIAVTVGIAISLPLAVWVARCKLARAVTLTVAGVIQTIPALALLALMVPLLGTFGLWPALTALVLYSVLPILRNTVTGLNEVDPDAVEAARGIGMTGVQVLMKVQLPLAAPVIIAGIRTATVWTVGMATLSTPVGQTSLGNYIFSGLQTRNWTAVLFGCVAAAMLAIVLEFLIGVLETSARKHSRPRAVAGVAALAIVLAGGLAVPALGLRPGPAAGPGQASPVPASPRRLVHVGSKPFTEQYVLARLIADQLGRHGFQVQLAESLGSTIAFDALCNDDLDVLIDYTGTIWANYMKRSQTLSAALMMAQVAFWLASNHQVQLLGPVGFENAYCLAMRRDRAAQLGIGSIDELARQADRLKIGSDYEFFNRPEWFKLRDTYALRFDRQVTLDPTFMYPAVVDGQVDLITAYSSDGRIAAFDLAVLEDRHRAFPPYDAVLLLGPAAGQDRDLVAALEPLVGVIDVGTMRLANQWVDVDGLTPTAAARRLAEWLKLAVDK